jgi:hypothetical protein
MKREQMRSSELGAFSEEVPAINGAIMIEIAAVSDAGGIGPLSAGNA